MLRAGRRCRTVREEMAGWRNLPSDSTTATVMLAGCPELRVWKCYYQAVYCDPCQCCTSAIYSNARERVYRLPGSHVRLGVAGRHPIPCHVQSTELSRCQALALWSHSHTGAEGSFLRWAFVCVVHNGHVHVCVAQSLYCGHRVCRRSAVGQEAGSHSGLRELCVRTPGPCWCCGTCGDTPDAGGAEIRRRHRVSVLSLQRICFQSIAETVNDRRDASGAFAICGETLPAKRASKRFYDKSRQYRAK